MPPRCCLCSCLLPQAALGGGLRLPWAAPDDVAALREELNRFVASGGLRPLAAAEVGVGCAVSWRRKCGC